VASEFSDFSAGCGEERAGLCASCTDARDAQSWMRLHAIKFAQIGIGIGLGTSADEIGCGYFIPGKGERVQQPHVDDGAGLAPGVFVDPDNEHGSGALGVDEVQRLVEV